MRAELAAGARPPRAWYERWVLVTVALTLLQAGVFWLLSIPGPRSDSRKGRPGVGQSPVVMSSETTDEWFWLVTPGLWLLPSLHGFSGDAWIRSSPLEFSFEPLTVGAQTLPFRPVSAMGSAQTLLPRGEPGPVARWAMPDPAYAPRMAGALALPTRVEVRVLAGSERREVLGVTNVDLPALDAVPRPVVARVWVNGAGDLVSPPLLWEGSGAPEADVAALKAIEQMTFPPPVPALGVRPSFDEWFELWIALEWPVTGQTSIPSPAAESP